MLENIHSASLTNLKNLDDCFLEVDHKEEETAIEKSFSLKEKSFFPNNFDQEDSFCSRIMSIFISF